MHSNRNQRLLRFQLILIIGTSLLTTGCRPSDRDTGSRPPSELKRTPTILLTNARVHTFAWPEPSGDGTPSEQAPQQNEKWTPEADAILVRNGRIAWLGTAVGAEIQINDQEHVEILDLGGATVLPGFVDSHTHVRELGTKLRRVDLLGVTSEGEVIDRLLPAAETIQPGAWIIGWGWDEGAWAAKYPDWNSLSKAFPDHPVALYSLHGFALWGNRAAFAAASISEETQAPTGGEVSKSADGRLTGILLNRATTLLTSAIPKPTGAEIEQDLLAGLAEMARSGYVSIHEAGLDRETLEAYQRLAARDQLNLRTYAMLSARDAELMNEWIVRGPDCDVEAMLRVCAVKAYWDGALGSRGARLLAEYSDRPGHRGISGEGYGFDQELVGRSAAAGFQVAVHAIGDAGNRETLDFFARTFDTYADARGGRHRVEHAQVIDPADVERFANLGLVASMQPPHVAEDQAWAEERLGPERARYAYAWRKLISAGVPMTFNSDLAGSDHSILYGLHSAVTRRPQPSDAERAESGGIDAPPFHADQAVTMEEAIRAYTLGGAFASFSEQQTGTIAVGHFADLTVLTHDPLAVSLSPNAPTPAEWWRNRVRLTMVGGQIVFDATQPEEE